MNDRKMVNLHSVTASLLKTRLEKINKARSKAGKRELNNGELIEVALTHLTVEMGVSK